MTLSEFTSRPGYQELIGLVKLFENLSDVECATNGRDLAMALAYSRLRATIADGRLRDEIIKRLKAVEYDSVIEEEVDDDGDVMYRILESDGLGSQAERVLGWRFRRQVRTILLEAISQFEPTTEQHLSPTAVPKAIFTFIEDEDLKALLDERWNEAWQCTSLGLLLSASTVLGSVLEGALIYYFEFVADQTVRDKYKLGADSDRWKLFKLVEAVVAEVKFRAGVPELTDQIREERNYIHPNVSMKSEPLTVEGLQTNFAIISELLARLSGHAAKVKP